MLGNKNIGLAIIAILVCTNGQLETLCFCHNPLTAADKANLVAIEPLLTGPASSCRSITFNGERAMFVRGNKEWELGKIENGRFTAAFHSWSFTPHYMNYSSDGEYFVYLQGGGHSRRGGVIVVRSAGDGSLVSKSKDWIEERPVFIDIAEGSRETVLVTTESIYKMDSNSKVTRRFKFPPRHGPSSRSPAHVSPDGSFAVTAGRAWLPILHTDISRRYARTAFDGLQVNIFAGRNGELRFNNEHSGGFNLIRVSSGGKRIVAVDWKSGKAGKSELWAWNNDGALISKCDLTGMSVYGIELADISGRWVITLNSNEVLLVDTDFGDIVTRIQVGDDLHSIHQKLNFSTPTVFVNAVKSGEEVNTVSVDLLPVQIIIGN